MPNCSFCAVDNLSISKCVFSSLVTPWKIAPSKNESSKLTFLNLTLVKSAFSKWALIISAPSNSEA